MNNNESSKIIISPSLLSADFTNLEKEIKDVEKAGASWLHVDVMDGHFVPNITIGVPVVKSIKKVASTPLDVHLMIENPDKFAKAFTEAGADILTFHFEAFNKDKIKTLNTINLIKSLGSKVGLSIKPNTKVEEIFEFLPELDLLLIMTVEPGFGGQGFLHECAEKINLLKQKAPKDLIIQVDGGINNITSRLCTSLGANSLVAGSYIFGHKNYKEAIESLK